MKNMIIKLYILTCSLIFTQMAFGENLALNLDGDGDYVTLPQIPPQTSYSVSFWFSPSATWDSSAVDRQIIYEANGPQPDTYVQLNDDGTVRYRTFTTPLNNLCSITDKWIAGAWYHITVTYDSISHIKSIYANGIEQSSDTLSINLSLNTENAHTIGRYTYTESQYFKGRIDEVRIWDHARTQEEILADMHTDLTGTEEGLVAYWNFDDGTANDGTANGYDGSLMGDAVITQSDMTNINYSFLSLDGDGDYVTLPQIPPQTSYSVSFWFSPSATWDSSAVDRQIIYEANGPQPDTYVQLNDDGTVRYRTFTTPLNNLCSITDKWIAGAWYHITVTYDSISHIKSIYANGIEQSSDTLSINLSLNTENAHTIGRYTYTESQYFKGRIDEVRIWDHARTQEEILADMHTDLTGTEEGLVAYWNFDDGTANDGTANGYDGTLMGEAEIITQPSVNVDPIISKLPKQCILKQNYPNPFNPTTAISYQLPQRSKVTLKIYNLLGKAVRTLVDKDQIAGSYSVIWDMHDDNGQMVSSGIYMYRLHTSDYMETRKMILIR